MTPFTCSNCGTPCSVDYLCPGCREPICDRCIHLGHEMEYALGKYRCAKCAKEDKMSKDGGAAFPAMWDYNGERVAVPGMTMRQWYKGMAMQGLIIYCEKFEGSTPFQNMMNGEPWEKIATIAGKYADAQLAEDAEREGKDG